MPVMVWSLLLVKLNTFLGLFCRAKYHTRQANVRIRNNMARLRNHCCTAKAISIVYSECVFAAFVIQHATRMLRIILSCVACLAVPYLSTLSLERQDFRGKKFYEYEMYVLVFSVTSHSQKNSASYYHECT